MSETRFLLMWLQGPLQAWGYDSKFGRKNTIEFPTKSGLFGMMCCAMGAGGEQKEWLASMAPLKNTILAYSKEKASPTLRDFHMIGSGYDGSDRFESQMMIISADQKNKKGTKLTYRYYLQDAYFAAIVEIPETQSDPLSHALVHPVWDVFLGRKNCAPSDFIFRGIFQTEEEALKKASEIAEEKLLKETFRVFDGQSTNGEIIALNDVPIEFGSYKKYKQRYVTVVQS